MKPETAIIAEQKVGGHTILFIDPQKAKYQNSPVRGMGNYGKRKLENWLVMTRPRERLKFVYKV